MALKQIRYAVARMYGPMWRLASGAAGIAGFRMLILHDVGPDEVGALDALLSTLKARTSIIGPDEAEEALSNRRSAAAGSTLISFDDGFRSNIDIARGVLAHHAVRALFFVCPGLIDNPVNVEHFFFPGMPSPPAERLALMNWEQIRELQRIGHTIGSHSLMHRRLSTLSDSELQTDVDRSYRRLNEELAIQPVWFAYPFGDTRSVSTPVLSAASRRFRYVCSGIRGINTNDTNRAAVLRESIDLAAPLHYNRMVAEGGLDLLYRSRVRLLNAMAEAAATRSN